MIKQFDEKGAVNFYQVQSDFMEELADKKSCIGASATLVCAYSGDEKVMIKNLGDSRAYVYRDKQWQLLTIDHTFINELKMMKNLMPIKSMPLFMGCLQAIFMLIIFMN